MLKIRSSMLNGYLDCARRSIADGYTDMVEEAGFALKHREPHIGACIGTATHSAGEHMLNNPQAPLNDSIEIGIESFKNEAVGEVIYDQVTPESNTAVIQVKALSMIYHQRVAPNIKPVEWKGKPGTEISLKAMIDKDTMLTGHIDVFDENIGAPRDSKFGSQNKNYFPQLGAYALLSKANGLEVKSSPIIDWVPRCKKDKIPSYNLITYDSLTCEKAGMMICRKIKADINKFKKTGNPWSFMPNVNSMLCSNKFCRAYGTDFCDLTKGKK